MRAGPKKEKVPKKKKEGGAWELGEGKVACGWQPGELAAGVGEEQLGVMR